MCKSKNNYGNIIYSKPDIIKFLDNDISLISNLDTDDNLKSFLDKLFALPTNQIPTLHPYLVMYINKRMLENNNLTRMVRKTFVSSVTDNIFNFSLAKTFQFLDVLRYLKKNDADTKDLKNYSNTIFSTQQATEEYQVSHLTTNISNVESSNYLEYVTAKDGNVRPEHKLQDGTVRPKKDIYWTKAMGLLSEWNCRCSIESASNEAKITLAPQVNAKTIEQPSDVDLQLGKAIIFKETLPVFQDLDPTVRNKFKRNGF